MFQRWETLFNFLCYFVCDSPALSPEVFIIITLQISRCLIAKNLCHLYWYDKSLQRIWVCSSIFSSSVFIPNVIFILSPKALFMFLSSSYPFCLRNFRRVRKGPTYWFRHIHPSVCHVSVRYPNGRLSVKFHIGDFYGNLSKISKFT